MCQEIFTEEMHSIPSVSKLKSAPHFTPPQKKEKRKKSTAADYIEKMPTQVHKLQHLMSPDVTT